MDERLEGNLGGNHASRSSNRNNGGSEDEGNPLLALSRFSKALSKYWVGISLLTTFFGSIYKISNAVDEKMTKTKTEIIDSIDDKYKIPFYEVEQCKKSIEDHETRLRNIEATKRR